MKKAAIFLLFLVFCLLFVSTLKGRETADEGTAGDGLGALLGTPDEIVWYEGERQLSVTDDGTIAVILELARPCLDRASGVGGVDSSQKELDRQNGALVFNYNEEKLINWDPGTGEIYGFAISSAWLYAEMPDVHVLLLNDDPGSAVLGCGFTVELYDYMNFLF